MVPKGNVKLQCDGGFVVIYYKTIIRFGFRFIWNNQGLGKCYQPSPKTSTLIIPDISKALSNNCLQITFKKVARLKWKLLHKLPVQLLNQFDSNSFLLLICGYVSTPPFPPGPPPKKQLWEKEKKLEIGLGGTQRVGSLCFAWVVLRPVKGHHFALTHGRYFWFAAAAAETHFSSSWRPG